MYRICIKSLLTPSASVVMLDRTEMRFQVLCLRVVHVNAMLCCAVKTCLLGFHDVSNASFRRETLKGMHRQAAACNHVAGLEDEAKV